MREKTAEPLRDDLRTVVFTASEFEAQAVVVVLEEAGIEAFAFGLMRQALPIDMKHLQVPVQVRASDVERARAVIEQNVSDSIDLDWDEIDVGEPDGDLPYTGAGRMPKALRAILYIGAVILLVTAVKLIAEAVL